MAVAVRNMNQVKEILDWKLGLMAPMQELGVKGVEVEWR